MNSRQTDNMQMAIQAMAYARGHIKYCYTAREVKKEDREASRLVSLTRNSFFSHDESILDLYSIPNDSPLRHITRSAKSAKKNEAGNCFEYANLVIKFLRKANVPAEIFVIAKGDHDFVVIGRKPGSDANDPLTWGEDAIICDALANACYKAVEWESKLQCHAFDSNPENELRNIYYPRIKEKLESCFSVVCVSNPGYHEHLVKEACLKIEYVKSVVLAAISNKLIPFEQGMALVGALFETKQAATHYLDDTKNTTTNDVERKMNQLVKKSLKLVLSCSESSVLRKNLIEAIVNFIKKSPNDAAKKEFFDSVEGFSNCPIHTKEVKGFIYSVYNAKN